MLDNVDFGLEMQLEVKSIPDYVDSPPFLSQHKKDRLMHLAQPERLIS